VGARAGGWRIDPRSPVPKYFQLRDILLELMTSNLAVDDPIPSERELKQRFRLSRMTVRQAIDHLVAEGRLYRVPGKGTFVARPKIEMPLRLASFTEDMRARGLTPGSREVSRSVIQAGQHLGTLLQIGPADEVYVFERLRLADHVPMAIERCHIPAAVAPGLITQGLTNRSLYAVLEVDYGIVLGAGEQTIESVNADPVDSRLLGIRTGAAVLLVGRRSFSGGVPIEYVVSTYRGDRYQLHVALDVPPHPSGIGGDR
jgi:GntR family transcriptional regulator